MKKVLLLCFLLLAIGFGKPIISEAVELKGNVYVDHSSSYKDLCLKPHIVNYDRMFCTLIHVHDKNTLFYQFGDKEIGHSSIVAYKNKKKSWELFFQDRVKVDYFDPNTKSMFVSTLETRNGKNDYYLYSVSYDGKINWKVNIQSMTDETVSYAFTKERIYVTAHGYSTDPITHGRIYAINYQGKVEWTYDFPRVVYSITQANDMVYAYAYIDGLVAINKKGERVWNFQGEEYSFHHRQSALSPNGKVLYHAVTSNADSKVYILALNAQSGEIIWKKEMKNGADIVEIVTLNDGTIVARDRHHFIDDNYISYVEEFLYFLSKEGTLKSTQVFKDVSPYNINFLKKNGNTLFYKELKNYEWETIVQRNKNKKYDGWYAFHSSGKRLYYVTNMMNIPLFHENANKHLGFFGYSEQEHYGTNIIYDVILPKTYNGKFKDVDDNFWGIGEIEYLNSKGIILGYENGTFKPNNVVTRAQAVVMLARTLKLDLENRPDPGFEDIQPSHWAYKELAALVDEGIYPKGKMFSPNIALQREIMARLLVNAYELDGKSNLTFKDIPTDYWASPYIDKLTANNITTGYPDGTFRPKGVVTRAQFSVFLARILDEGFLP